VIEAAAAEFSGVARSAPHVAASAPHLSLPGGAAGSALAADGMHLRIHQTFDEAGATAASIALPPASARRRRRDREIGIAATAPCGR